MRRLALLLLVAATGCGELAGLGAYGRAADDDDDGGGGAMGGSGATGGADIPRVGGGGTGGASVCASDGAYADVIVQALPAAYWRFEELNGAQASATVGPAATYDARIELGQASLLPSGDGCAVFLPASDSEKDIRIVAPDLGVDFTSAFSIELWFAPDGNVFGTLVDKTTNDVEAGFALSADQAFVSVAMHPAGGSIGKSLTSPTTHVVAIYDDNSQPPRFGLYVDGALAGSLDLDSPPTQGADPLRIGQGFRGTIDEVVVYDRALNASEVQAHFDAGAAN